MLCRRGVMESRVHFICLASQTWCISVCIRCLVYGCMPVPCVCPYVWFFLPALLCLFTLTQVHRSSGIMGVDDL